jgi:PAS domain S-box-containing protein
MENLENTILYIDDEEVNLILFEATFSKYYTVVTANSTKNAEKLINENMFKVIISDISMPQETGLEFFKRTHFLSFEPILIILTAFVNNTLLLEALNQGRIFRYLTKPWKKDELKHAIDQAIQTFDLYFQNKMLDIQIKESEQKFHNIFQYSRDSIIIFDYQEKILEANINFLKTIRKKPDEIKNVRVTDFLDNESKEHFKDGILQLTSTGTFVFEYDFYITDCETRIVEANSCMIDYKGEVAILSIMRDITERKLHEKAIFNAVIQAEEKERSRIAKDLHDGLGPILATLKMYVEWLKEKEIEQHPDILSLSVSSVNEAITTLKSISNNLSPHVLENFGLVPALTSFVERIKKISQIKFNIETNLKDRLSTIIEITFYRIIIECINNTIKHSMSTDISIKLHRSDNSLIFNYMDNGNGFDIMSALESRTGMGLHNMQNRIKSLGGKINFQSIIGQGTKISAEILIKN